MARQLAPCFGSGMSCRTLNSSVWQCPRLSVDWLWRWWHCVNCVNCVNCVPAKRNFTNRTVLLHIHRFFLHFLRACSQAMAIFEDIVIVQNLQGCPVLHGWYFLLFEKQFPPLWAFLHFLILHMLDLVVQSRNITYGLCDSEYTHEDRFWSSSCWWQRAAETFHVSWLAQRYSMGQPYSNNQFVLRNVNRVALFCQRISSSISDLLWFWPFFWRGSSWPRCVWIMPTSTPILVPRGRGERCEAGECAWIYRRPPRRATRQPNFHWNLQCLKGHSNRLHDLHCSSQFRYQSRAFF